MLVWGGEGRDIFGRWKMVHCQCTVLRVVRTLATSDSGALLSPWFSGESVD